MALCFVGCLVGCGVYCMKRNKARKRLSIGDITVAAHQAPGKKSGSLISATGQQGDIEMAPVGVGVAVADSKENPDEVTGVSEAENKLDGVTGWPPQE